MRATKSARRHVAILVRVSVVTLLAGLLHVVGAAPASAALPTGDANHVGSPEPGKVHLVGWAADPDNQSVSIDVHVYFGPVGAAHGVNLGPANTYRPDVPINGGAAGDYHGFDIVIDVPLAGDYEWRIHAIDLNGEGNPIIDSGRVTIADASPSGAVESSSSSVHRTIDLAGWASDPSTPSSAVAIEVYIGGSFNTPGVDYKPMTANIARSDGKRGFSGRLSTTKTGVQPVYVYAKNVPGTPGADRLIGIVQVTIYVDTTAPNTKITSAPEFATTDDVIHVTFSADEPNATFQCRWDLEPWFTCQTGAQIKLTPGKHQISVRATDAYGNQDATPAVFLVTVSAAPTTQPPPPVGQNDRSIAARAVKKKSKLRIDVGPDSASSNYRVVIKRKVGKRWRKVERVRTRGPKDTVVVNLRRGRYRVVLPKSSAGAAVTSNTVRLKR
jgi:hypothetical protein